MSGNYEMTIKDNTDLIVSINILNRVENMLSKGTRVQLQRDTLSSIADYLAKAVKYINPNFKELGSYYIIFCGSIKAINELLEKEDFIAVTSDTKTYLVDKLTVNITEYKVCVGKYLFDHEFNYSTAMDSVLKNIIDTCIQNKCYFCY